jgi:hypothetical protein
MASLYRDSIAIPKAELGASRLCMPASLLAAPKVPVARRPLHASLPLGFVLENVLSRDECAALCAKVAELGLSFYNPDPTKRAFRACDTVEVRHEEFAQALFERIRPALAPDEAVCHLTERDARFQRDLEGTWKADGTVDLVLFSRYGPGGHFAAHTDGFNVDTFDRRSLFSIVLYLNDVAPGSGGETVFFAPSARRDDLRLDEQGRYLGDDAQIVATVRPVAGTAAIFFHNYLHQSQPTADADKVILRSDIMYIRDPPLLTAERDRNAFRLYMQAERMAESAQDAPRAAELFRTAFKSSPVLAGIYGS